MARFEQVGGFILAGGASSRMGHEKALLEFRGEPLIVRAARLLEPLTGSLTIIGPPQLFAALGLNAVPDDHEAFGPLGGIATALRVTTQPWNLIVACDLPYLTQEWLEFLIQRALESSAAAVMPEGPEGAEPLCAMYHKQAEAPISEALGRGIRKVTDGLAGIVVVNLAPHEWKPFDSEGQLFKNINTPADFEELRASSGGKAKS